MPHPRTFVPRTLAHTYSIVAYDPEARQWGVAVQSHYLNVGGVVPWVEPGVGAVATQSMVEASYGPLGLALMRGGNSAGEALAGLVAADANSSVRQVAVVDAEGRVAAHTGARCIPDAGHRTGTHYSVQANMMAKSTVWDAMAEAFEGSTADLPERMLFALEAAEVEAGDIRGRQSAALVVARGEMTGKPWAARPFDLRVDDSPEPLIELRRLLNVTRAYQFADSASTILKDESLGEARFGKAMVRFAQARALEGSMPGNAELIFWFALDLVEQGRWDDASPLLREAYGAYDGWRDLIRRLVPAGLLPDDPALLERLTSL